MPTRLLAAAMMLTVASCGETLFYAATPITSDLRVNARANTVMVNAVSMPEYAINQEIPIQRTDGSLVTDGDRLWADLPDRALQVALSRHLSQITGSQVSVEPWPLSGFPEAEVSVTVNDMIVRADGTLRFNGSFAIRDELRRGGRVDLFDIVVPVSGDGFGAIVAAHERAWLELAEDVAAVL